MPVLVVDAANVVGSVPDGWWRDRAGAAARLHARLLAASLPYERVVVVLEGRARGGVPAGIAGNVHTVHASGAGDDELVAQCVAAASEGVTLVTADRGLIARVAQDAQVVGPARLLADLSST